MEGPTIREGSPTVGPSNSDHPGPPAEEERLRQLQRDAHCDDAEKRSAAMSRLARRRWEAREARIRLDLPVRLLITDSEIKSLCPNGFQPKPNRVRAIRRYVYEASPERGATENASDASGQERPRAPGSRALIRDPRFLEWLRHVQAVVVERWSWGVVYEKALAGNVRAAICVLKRAGEL